MNNSKPLVVLNSHPIQYFAPLYKYSVENGLDIEVWYCSKESIQGNKDQDFGVTVRWDIPLLDGYRFRFFKNYSWKPSVHSGFFGLINLGLIPAVLFRRRSVIVIHGWNFCSTILVLFFGMLRGHKLCIRAETPLNQSFKSSPFKAWFKKATLKIFFTPISHFLYIGYQNKLFYEYLGVPEKKLLYAPYCVDNFRFQENARSLKPQVNSLKKELGIPDNFFTLVYSGKYIKKKRPLVLLEAFAKLKAESKNLALVMIGEGELRCTMEKFIKENKLDDVILTGFVNQSQISRLYAVADLFVMCSGDGETWGLSTNEVMNFSVPVVVSDRCGCAYNLVHQGINGYTYELDNIQELVSKITLMIGLDKKQINLMGSASLEIINKFSYHEVLKALKVLKINCTNL